MGLFSFLKSIVVAQTESSQHKKYLQSLDFQKRLLRARDDSLQIVEYKDRDWTAARIRNTETGAEYNTTLYSCECEDFRKMRKPCKHMIFLTLKSGRCGTLEKTPPKKRRIEEEQERFIPRYWEYYDGPPTGIGYANFYPYEVSGRKYGVSEKTGRQTNRASRIVVMANNESEAIDEAKKQGTMPPYSKIELLDFSPSYEQIKYLEGVGIPHPNMMCSEDVRALLTRYQEKDDSRPTKGIISLANEKRIQISMFSSQKQIASYVWAKMDEAEAVRYFCYAVFCQERKLVIGETMVKHTDSSFDGFRLTKKQIAYIRLTIPGYERLNGRSGAYKAAKEYIQGQNFFLKKFDN